MDNVLLQKEIEYYVYLLDNKLKNKEGDPEEINSYIDQLRQAHATNDVNIMSATLADLKDKVE